MGIHVQKKAQKSFNQHIDKAMAEVKNGDLFDQPPQTCDRKYVAEPCSRTSLNVGEKVSLELKGDTVIGTRSAEKVLKVSNPNPELASHVRSQSGIAEANISKLNPLSQTVEIELCQS